MQVRVWPLLLLLLVGGYASCEQLKFVLQSHLGRFVNYPQEAEEVGVEDGAGTERWDSWGDIVFRRNEIVNVGDAGHFIEKKLQFVQQLSQTFDFALFRLCEKGGDKGSDKGNDEGGDKGGDTSCIQAFVTAADLDRSGDFYLLVGLNNAYRPYILNYRSRRAEGKETGTGGGSSRLLGDLVHVRTLNVQEPIRASTVQMDKSSPSSRHEKDAKESTPQSFFRKYWYAFVIFFVGVSISKQFSEHLQETINLHNAGSEGREGSAGRAGREGNSSAKRQKIE